MMPKTFICLTALSLLVMFSFVPARVSVSAEVPAQASRAQVEGLLSGYEYMPSRNDLDRLGSGVADHLVEIASDPSSLNAYRMRALKLLAHYADQPAVQTYLNQFLDRKDHPFAYRRAALIALGSVPEGKSIDRIATFLDSPDLQVRSAAAQALAKTKDRRAASLLKRASGIEKDSHLQQKMATLALRLEEGK